MSTRLYDTDLTDAAWAFVAPVLPAARPGGRPRTTNLRAVLNAIFYLLRTGCQWRLLPREFPPCGTVYHYFQAWQNSGVWVHLHRVLYEQGPSSGRTVRLSIGGDHGWPIGQDDRAWWCSWFRCVQAREGTQTPHLGRHTRPTGCQPCRTGGHIRSACGRPAAWRIERVVSENPDDNSRGRPRKPKFALTLKQHQGWQLRIVKRRQRAFKLTDLN